MSYYSGSTYDGETKDGWYHGKGVFTYPSGVRYEGNFFKGQFHGKGTLIYKNGGYYEGIWEHGKKISGDYFFYDKLKFEEENWDYCTGKDRKFNYERNHGIKPSGQTQITNNHEGENAIPPGTYDTGDGYFDPIRTLVYSYDGKKLLRTPDSDEVDWITRTCRYEPRESKVPLTGEEDEIVMRVMELQDEGRRGIAEELMKEGVEEPNKYDIIEETIDEKVEEKQEEKVEEKKEEKVEEKKEVVKPVVVVAPLNPNEEELCSDDDDE